METTKLLTGALDDGKRAPLVQLESMRWFGRRLERDYRAQEPGETLLAKAELGEKQVCPSCGAKFYDLQRRPAVCPKCATAFDPAEEGVKVKRGRGRVAAYGRGYEDEEEAEAAEGKEKTEDAEEEEVEETPAIDAPGVEEVVVSDEDEDVEPAGDELPPGFSEEEADLEDDAADDDVPLLEDEEEFPEDEIGELPADDEDESGR